MQLETGKKTSSQRRKGKPIKRRGKCKPSLKEVRSWEGTREECGGQGRKKDYGRKRWENIRLKVGYATPHPSKEGSIAAKQIRSKASREILNG